MIKKMKLRKKLEARLGSVSLACFRDLDCGNGPMNDFLPALSLRAILHYMKAWNNLVSFPGFYPTRPPPSRRRLWD